MDEKEEQGKKRWKRKKTSLRSMTGRDLSLSLVSRAYGGFHVCCTCLSFSFLRVYVKPLDGRMMTSRKRSTTTCFFFLFYSLAFKVLVSSDKITTEAFFFFFLYLGRIFLTPKDIYTFVKHATKHTSYQKKTGKKKKS